MSEKHTATIADLAMLVRRLSRYCSNPTLKAQAEGYLRRHNLEGSILRAAVPAEDSEP